MLDRLKDAGRLDGELFRAMVESAADGILLIDEGGIVELMNPAAEILFGYAADEVLGRNVRMLMPEPYHSQHDEYLRRYLQTGRRKIIGIGREVSGLRKDGTTFPMYLSVTEVRKEQGHVFVGIVHDLTESKQAAREMSRMRSYLKNIIDSMPSVLIGVDADGRITEWNHEAELVTGVSAPAAMGRGFETLLPQLESQLEAIHEAIADRYPVRMERLPSEGRGEIRYSDIVVYPLIANGTIGAVIRVDDVTNRVRIEQMMVQTEKMMSVGGLAAGMAHEINNPLSAVLQGHQNIVRRLSSELEANRKVADEVGVDLEKMQVYFERRGIVGFLHGIQDAASRAGHIVADMLAFSRSSDVELLPTRVEDLLETVLRLASSDYDLKKRYDFRQIEIVRDFAPEVAAALCDRREIEQVFLNVIKNAAQAMTTSGQPLAHRITLRTRAEPKYVRVEIEDNGPGMDPKTRARVFEPFFTTKPAGQGTGLGLSVSYFIITEHHGGTISVSSAPGKGTCFIVRLPASQEAAA